MVLILYIISPEKHCFIFRQMWFYFRHIWLARSKLSVSRMANTARMAGFRNRDHVFPWPKGRKGFYVRAQASPHCTTCHTCVQVSSSPPSHHIQQSHSAHCSCLYTNWMVSCIESSPFLFHCVEHCPCCCVQSKPLNFAHPMSLGTIVSKLYTSQRCTLLIFQWVSMSV